MFKDLDLKLNNENSKNITKAFFVLFLFAFILRLIISVGYFNSFDTYWYRNWAIGTQNGIFDLYLNKDVNLDYPPIYVLFLSVTGFFYRFVGNTAAHDYVQMLFMKSWPVIFDMLASIVIFKFSKKHGSFSALFASALWLFSPAGIFNSSFWGQTDGLMCLLLLLSFWLLEKNPVLASVMFAVSGLTKFQCLYFTPVFLFILFYRYKFKKFLLGIIFAALTVFIVFLPFMIACNKPLLFFEVYLNGSGSYPYCTLNAFNFYGIFGLNWVEETTPLFFGINYSHINILITVLIIVGILLLLYFGKNKCPYVSSLLTIEALFMFTTRMHERYQFVALIFALICLVLYKNKDFLRLFILLNIIITINQVVPMFDWQKGGSFLGGSNYSVIMSIVSILNLLLFIYCAYVCIKFIKGSEGECLLAQESESF